MVKEVERYRELVDATFTSTDARSAGGLYQGAIKRGITVATGPIRSGYGRIFKE